MTADGEPVLDVQDLRTYLHTRAGVVRAVDGVDFTVHAGEAVGLVGESGSGKSMTCLSIVRLLPQPAGRNAGGRILLEGEDLLGKSEREMRRIRGDRVSMILQDHLLSLNPTYTVGSQVAEPFQLAGGRTRAQVRDATVDVLTQVRIPAAAERLGNYPHQFSGGMRQRVVAAMAIARNPALLIADEPTTALDVTVQDQFLRLLKEMQREHGMALLMVTHDLGIVAETCDRVAIMYAGRIVETGTVDRVFTAPAHPYTQALLRALPRMEDERRRRLHQIEGEPPSPSDVPQGCRFAPRCPHAMDICRAQYPPAFRTSDGGHSNCWLMDDTRPPAAAAGADPGRPVQGH